MRKSPRKSRTSTASAGQAAAANEPDENNNSDTESIVEESVEFEGDEYIDKDGVSLTEDKKVQVMTFTLNKRHPTKRYMLMLDLARSMQVHDSFRFMKIYPNLPRINIAQDEREGLIDQGVMHPIMKFRNVPCVSVTAAYMKFGQRLFDEIQPFVSSVMKEDASSAAEILEDTEEDGLRRQRMHVQAMKDNVTFDHLVNVPPATRDNGDWIFNCAVATAKFNVGLRFERFDRLWGDEEIVEEKAAAMAKRKSFREDNTDDEFDEDSDVDGEREARKRVYRKKNGFYDVHTNVIQVPRATQIPGITIQPSQLDFDDLLKKKTLADEYDSIVDMAYAQKNQPPTAAPQKTLAHWFGPQYSQTKAVRCPLAIMPGQYQGSFSVYSERFVPVAGAESTDVLANSASLSHFVGSSNFVAPPINRVSAAQSFTPAVPVSQNNIYFVNGKMHTSTDLNLSLDSNGKSRKSLLESAPVSPQAVNLNAGSKACATCDKELEYGSIPGLEESEREPLLICNVELINNDAIQCTRCYNYHHIKCVEHSSDLMSWKIRAYKWECADCKLCSRCFLGEEKSGKDQISMKGSIVFCDACDRGWHQGCFTPPMHQLPDGSWTCEMCAKCNTCGATGSPPFFKDLNLTHRFATHKTAEGKEKKIYLTTLCDKCLPEFDADHFCAVCIKAAPLSTDGVPVKKFKSSKLFEVSSMVKCGECVRWIHYPACDNQAFQKYGNSLLQEGAAGPNGAVEEYSCSVCRVVSGASLDTKKRSKSPAKKANISHDVKPFDLDEDDVEELERKRALQDKVYHRKRGRPRKIRPEEELRVIHLEEVTRPLKPREVCWYKDVDDGQGGKRASVVVIPAMRVLHDWAK